MSAQTPIPRPGDRNGGAGGGGAFDPGISRRLLNLGFLIGLLFSAACLVLAAWYLISFEWHAERSVQSALMNEAGHGDAVGPAVVAQMFVTRVLLISCGVCVGLCFGFLGFALLLFGVQGNIDAEFKSGNKAAFHVSRLSPGAFVILCATLLIAVCVMQTPTANYHKTEEDSRASPVSSKDQSNDPTEHPPDNRLPGK